MTTATTNDLALVGSRELSFAPGSPEFREHVERGAAELARIFHETTSAMRRHWAAIHEATTTLDEAMKEAPVGYGYRDFRVDLYYDGHHVWDGDDKPAIDAVIWKMNVKVWARLIDKMGIKNLMSIKRREEFEKQVKDGDVPEVTEENIIAVIMGLADRAAEFATEAAKEALALLTPASGRYKTNSGFRVGRRAILTYHVERDWAGGFRPNYYREQSLLVLDGTFHVLDEKGPIRDRQSPLVSAIKASGGGGRGETDYFRFRCFKNGNLHLEFRRPDLVKKLNGLATGEYVLGQDIE